MHKSIYCLGLAFTLAGTPSLADSKSGTKSLFWMNETGYHENTAALKGLETSNPAAFAQMRKEADDFRRRVDEQMAADGGKFKGLKPTLAERKMLDEGREPTISGKDIPSTIEFKQTGKKSKK